MAVVKLDLNRLDAVTGGATLAESVVLPTSGDIYSTDIFAALNQPESPTMAGTVGGAGNDILHGGSAGERFEGGGGADRINAGGGDDLILGNDLDGRNDVVDGGKGNDTYAWAPGSGSDSFNGSAGDDVLMLRGVSLESAVQGLSMDSSSSLSLSRFGQPSPTVVNGELCVLNANGDRQPFSGTLRIGGEVLTLTNVERIVIG